MNGPTGTRTSTKHPPLALQVLGVVLVLSGAARATWFVARSARSANLLSHNSRVCPAFFQDWLVRGHPFRALCKVDSSGVSGTTANVPEENFVCWWGDVCCCCVNTTGRGVHQPANGVEPK